VYYTALEKMKEKRKTFKGNKKDAHGKQKDKKETFKIMLKNKKIIKMFNEQRKIISQKGGTLHTSRRRPPSTLVEGVDMLDVNACLNYWCDL